MPKNNKITKINNNIHKQKVPAKLRIGTRKTGKAANAMKTAELQAVLEAKDKSRWHQSARTVLRMRGIL